MRRSSPSLVLLGGAGQLAVTGEPSRLDGAWSLLLRLSSPHMFTRSWLSMTYLSGVARPLPEARRQSNVNRHEQPEIAMPAPRSPDTPILVNGGDDNLEAGRSRPPLNFGTDSEVGKLVAQTVATLMNASGDDAEQTYQRRLDRLRERADDVVTAVGAQYDELDEDQYLERWSMIQLLADLRHPSSLRVLENVFRHPIPPERSPDPAHGLSTVGEEIIIRTTAVEALARLAADGDRATKELLLAQVRHDAFSVRRAAVQAIADSGDAELLERVRQQLAGSDDQRLLEYRRIDVRSAPQAEGGRFLKEGNAPPPETPQS